MKKNKHAEHKSNKTLKSIKNSENFYHKPSLMSNFTYNCDKNKRDSDQKKQAIIKKASLCTINNTHFSVVSKKAADKNKQNLMKNKISYITSHSSLEKTNCDRKDSRKPEVALSKASLVTITTHDSKTDNIRSVFGTQQCFFLYLFSYREEVIIYLNQILISKIHFQNIKLFPILIWFRLVLRASVDKAVLRGTKIKISSSQATQRASI